MWECELARVDNGYVLKYWEIGLHRIVFEEPDTETGELEAIKALLQATAEYFGVTHSKHNKHNLEIRITGKEDENAPRD